MKVLRQLGTLTFEVEGDTQISLFEGLAEVDRTCREVFGEPCCGVCGSENIVFKVRDVEKEDPKTKKQKKYRYYEMQCQAKGCWAKLSFGQHQEGDTLFPKGRKNDDGTWNKARGWAKWEKEKEAAEHEGGTEKKVPF